MVSENDKQIHRLQSRLWVIENSEYSRKVNNIRARIKYRTRMIPKMEQKIITYVEKLESDMEELKMIERGGRPRESREGWSSLCKTGRHQSSENTVICKGKGETCKCYCHGNKDV